MHNIVAESKRCLNCVKPLCKLSCPVGNNIPAFLQKICDGKYREAADIIGHPFGEICGYVCPHEKQCMGGCVLGKRGSAINTGEVERSLFAEYPYVAERRSDALNGCKFAVIGGGVSGLTFAVKAYEQGAEVTVFEQDELLSTLSLIPSFRLPEEAILRVKNAVCGKFNIQHKQIAANDITRLKRQFDAVYVASGLTLDYGLGVEGQALACDYKQFLKGNIHGKSILAVGGGNSAIDCARLAMHKGCQATIVYRRTREDMPAFSKEIEVAEREGVRFVFNAAPVKLVENDDGLTLTVARTESEGRGKLTVTNDVYELNADTVVSAVGSCFDESILVGQKKNTNAYLQFENVYLGGDANRGKLVADAVADGLKVANEVINARKICLSTK